MKRDAKSKLSASLIVLVLGLSALVLIPAGNTGQAPSGKSIYVPVLSGGLPVTNAYVNLTDVHTGDVTPAQFTSSVSAYVVSNAVSGYYRIDVVAPNHLDALNAATFSYDGFNNLTVTPILLTAFPAKTFTWNITVTASDTDLPIQGASLGFYNLAANEFVATVSTNSQGVAIIPMFGTTAGQYALVGRCLGRETNVTGVTVTGSNVSTMELKPSTYVSAVVTGPTGTLAVNPVSYLINVDPTIPKVKRVLKSTLGVYFDSYPGTYTMVIDADGAAADVETVVVASTPLNLQRTLPAQTQRVERVNTTFGADFNSLTLDVATTWSYDDPYPGLFYNDMGSLRTQIDLALGNGDGTLSAPEVTAFIGIVNGFGTQYVTTSSLMTVNSTVYQTSGAMTNFVLGLVAGLDTDTGGVNYGYQQAYVSHTSLANGVSLYSMSFSARLNNANVDYKYTIPLVAGYELVNNQSTNPATKVLGYLTVTVDSNRTGSGTELVLLTIEKSVKPVPVAGLDTPPTAVNAAVIKNATGVIQRYIVKDGSPVSFTANGTTDPNGNKLPLTFTWNFNDSSPLETTSNRTIRHTYVGAFDHRVITMTATDVAGLTNSTRINVTCDALEPTPLIGVLKFPVVSNEIKVNQSQIVTFNSLNSTDDAATVGDGKGVIDFVQWDFGDGNFTSRIFQVNPQKNVTHAYTRAGNYNLTLNVTDVVGHFKNTTMKVHVNDTSAPVVAFTVRNSTWKDALFENDTVHFDANTTRDNIDNYTVMYYSWNFGDGTWDNGTGKYNVTHTYQRIGGLTVSLRVQDLSGNNGSLAKGVTIKSGPRPNVIIDNIAFSPQTASPFTPSNLTAGSKGMILVNLTNAGNFVANNVVVTVYIVPEGGGALQQIATGGAAQMYNSTTGALVSTIEIGGKVQLRIPYTPPNQGTFTIRVNATSDNQLTSSTRLASGANALHVKSSPLMTILLWVGVIVIIVAIPTLLYVRSRLAKREKKGPRRPERKEREPEEE